MHEPQRAQLGEAFGVELGLEAGVELIQGLMVRQPGELQARRVAAALEHADLALEDEVEELAVAKLAGLGAVDQFVGGVGEAVELELAGVAANPLGDSSPIDRLLVARQRPMVHLRVRERGEDLGQRHGVLGWVRQHASGPAALVPRDPPAVQEGVDLRGELELAEG